MSSRCHRDESGEDEGSHDFGSLRFDLVLPIKTLSNWSGIALVALFSSLTLIAVLARSLLRSRPRGPAAALSCFAMCLASSERRGRDDVRRRGTPRAQRSRAPRALAFPPLSILFMSGSSGGRPVYSLKSDLGSLMRRM
jgi:hypothetical protein